MFCPVTVKKYRRNQLKKITLQIMSVETMNANTSLKANLELKT